MILTLTVQELLAGIEAPVGAPKVSVVLPAPGAHVGAGIPPHVVAAAGVAATCKPVGNVSVKVTPSRAIEFELDNVNLSVDVPFTGIGLVKKVFVMVGGVGMAQPVKVTLSTNISEPELTFPELKK